VSNNFYQINVPRNFLVIVSDVEAMKRKLVQIVSPDESRKTKSRCLFTYPRAVTIHILKFLTNDYNDNQLYRTLSLVCKQWKPQDLPIFSLDLEQEFESSWIHALCCDEINIGKPKSISTSGQVSRSQLLSYSKAPLDTDVVEFGLCCWEKIRNFESLTELHLTCMVTQDFSSLTNIRRFEVAIQESRFPLRLPPNIECLELRIMGDVKLEKMMIQIPLNVEEMVLETEYPSDLQICWPAGLVDLTLVEACPGELAGVSYPSTIETLNLDQCDDELLLPNLDHLPNLSHLFLPANYSNGEALQQLGNLANLEWLHIRIPLSDWSSLFRFKKLKGVYLSGGTTHPSLSDTSFFYKLAKSPSIEKLTFDGSDEKIVYCPKTETLIREQRTTPKWVLDELNMLEKNPFLPRAQ
jgi:hypothetical protein